MRRIVDIKLTSDELLALLSLCEGAMAELERDLSEDEDSALGKLYDARNGDVG